MTGSSRSEDKNLVSLLLANPSFEAATRSDIAVLLGLKGHAFSYNARALHSWGVFPVVFSGTLWRIFSWHLHMQGLVLAIICGVVPFIASASSRMYHWGDCMINDLPDLNCYAARTNLMGIFQPAIRSNLGTLCRFVLGLFVSLALARTYYSNRALLGTTFSCVLGLGMMTASHIRPIDELDVDQVAEVKEIHKTLVRWGNAGFRLMYLENRGDDKAMVKSGRPDMMEGLLTDEEWAEISPLPSRCTYIWQWYGQLINECQHQGYISNSHNAQQFHQRLETLRGANVWGLPSLPYPYVLLVTIMVKVTLLTEAFSVGTSLCVVVDIATDYGWKLSEVVVFASMILYVLVCNLAYQGLLELHSILCNPNGDKYIGHLPTPNFLEFTKKVTNNMISNIKPRFHFIKPRFRSDKSVPGPSYLAGHVSQFDQTYTAGEGDLLGRNLA